MISKQESKEEPLDQKNDKLLHKQLKELMGDKEHSEKALNNIKAHNGDSKDKVAKNSDSTSSQPATEVEVFDDSILKYIQRSKHFQDYLKEKGVLPATGTEGSISRGLDETGGEENRPLSEQFEEIELQKEILNLKEKQLRNRDKNKVMAKKKEMIREKEIAQAMANHKLHLTNPEREKVNAEKENEFKELKHFAEEYRKLRDRKIAENELRNKGYKEINSRSQNTKSKNKESSSNVDKKEISPSKPKKEEDDDDGKSKKELDNNLDATEDEESSGDAEDKETENGNAKENGDENADDQSGSSSNDQSQSNEIAGKTTNTEDEKNKSVEAKE